MTTSWASVPRTRAPRADLPPADCTPPGVRSAALAVSGALLAASVAGCLAPLLTAAPVRAQEAAAQEPAQLPEALAAPSSSGRTVVFDYSAAVTPNDVYDTERAEAPLPLFRTLGDRVDVEAAYTGPAARLGLVARLLSTTGWSATVPLADQVQVEGRGRVRATLDLPRLEARAAVVAEQTGMPFEGLTIELVAVVRDDAGTWRPSVPLLLTTQQLRLAGEPATLVVRQEATATTAAGLPAAPTPQSRLDDLLGWRPGGMLTTLALVLAAGGGVVVLRRRQDEDDTGRVRRRLGRLLLEVRPLDLSGVRVVEVAAPDALGRLAERYGLLVLHWTDVSGAVFVVHDEAIAYRWTAATVSEVPPAGQTDGDLPEPVTAEREPQPAALPVDTQVKPEPEPGLANDEVEPGVGETALALLSEEWRQVAERWESERQAGLREEEAREEAARAEALREEAARREADRQEAARLAAERRRHAEAAEIARAEVARARARRLEAERLERQRQQEAEEALRLFEAAEREHGTTLQRVTIDVPAPRSGDRQDRRPDRQDQQHQQSGRLDRPAAVLADGPPREADDRPRPEPSFWQVG